MAVRLMKMRKAAAGLPEGKSAGRRTEDTRFCRFEDERWEKIDVLACLELKKKFMRF